MPFVKFPHTPHLAWLGGGDPRDDKVLTPSQVQEFLSHEVVVEEKVDGANIGLSVDPEGVLRAHNRGSFLSPAVAHPQFRPLFGWIARHSPAITGVLGANLILFGEWCYATHAVNYTLLPDWFLAFDIYDKNERAFWSTTRRDLLVRKLGLKLVPQLRKGRFDLARLKDCMQLSRLSNASAEGIYLRWDQGAWLGGRAKLVRPGFVQSTEKHWSRRRLQPNSLLEDATW